MPMISPIAILGDLLLRYKAILQKKSCNPCPACGGLQCLCRPRFFAGQLLTEQDLNRLDRYIIEKNRLHNRYLHGWGVVCGLEVDCNPCNGMVTVHPGYALSPCGDDIIVCSDAPVDVCKLITQCQPMPPDCTGPQSNPNQDCLETEQAWVLAICYDEQPSRGVAALRASTSAPCCSRCNCGGSSACGCGCHSSAGSSANGSQNQASNGSGARTMTAYAAPRSTPAQCEPTVLCEGYTFKVYKAPKPVTYKIEDPGALVDNIIVCLLEFFQAVPPLPSDSTTQAMLDWCCSLKASLIEFFATHGTEDCALFQRVSAMTCPQPNANETPDQYRDRVLGSLAYVGGEYILHCVCSAMLPPCPEPADDNCVPLATILVRRRDCKILRVCEWEPRRFVVTFPTLGYWLSPFGLTKNLHKLIDFICCTLGAQFSVPQQGPINERMQPDMIGNVTPVHGNIGGRTPTTGTVSPGGEGMTREQDLMNMTLEALMQKNRQVDARTVFLGGIGATDLKGNPYMTPTELFYAPEFLMIRQVLAPLIENALPSMLRGEVSRVASAMEQTDTPATADRPPEPPPEPKPSDIDTLKTQVAGLQETLRQQQELIAKLSARQGKR
jgi:hypothetical protein